MRDVPVGSAFLVKPGERIALDGVVRSGVSAVNQAPITGESILVSKEPGAGVFAGTINGDGALEIESTKIAGESTLAGIIRMVGQAQTRRAAAEQWVDRYGTVAMIGDGVNDAPAMARATLGVAMGAAGSDAAIETADVALMADDLSRLPWLVHHSRRAVGIIKANIALSIGVKVVFVLLTLGGFASLWAAVAADMGVSLLVIANALRLLRASV